MSLVDLGQRSCPDLLRHMRSDASLHPGIPVRCYRHLPTDSSHVHPSPTPRQCTWWLRPCCWVRSDHALSDSAHMLEQEQPCKLFRSLAKRTEGLDVCVKHLGALSAWHALHDLLKHADEAHGKDLMQGWVCKGDWCVSTGKSSQCSSERCKTCGEEG